MKDWMLCTSSRRQVVGEFNKLGINNSSRKWTNYLVLNSSLYCNVKVSAQKTVFVLQDCFYEDRSSVAINRSLTKYDRWREITTTHTEICCIKCNCTSQSDMDLWVEIFLACWINSSNKCNNKNNIQIVICSTKMFWLLKNIWKEFASKSKIYGLLISYLM